MRYKLHKKRELDSIIKTLTKLQERYNLTNQGKDITVRAELNK